MRQGEHLGRYPNRPGKQMLMEDKDGVKLQDSKYILEAKPKAVKMKTHCKRVL